MGLIDGVAQYLGSAVDGLAYSEAGGEGNVFVDFVPTEPDRAVAVLSSASAGEPDSKLPYDPVEVEVIVRGEANSTTWSRAMVVSVYSALHGLRATTLPDGTRLAWLLARQGGPVPLGRDDGGRLEYSITFSGEIINPTAARSE